jgi:diaminohydroxyphosphoribosylaminopyrimidine deaminase/5-amino-6-(5-phosphoribosylamino)uracil reductase
VALAQAGTAAAGATLYVTLEPCCHYGRTPPCSEALARAGVRAVQVAMIDPSPWVAGGGCRDLQNVGIEVVIGHREQEARRLNEGYFKYVAHGLPFVTAKWAMTLDGKIATASGSSYWVTGDEARARVAQMRARSDAVLVGVGTVLADNPQLTVRPESFPPALRARLDGLPPRQPLRVIVDSRARTPPLARVASGELPGRTLVLVTDHAPPERRAALEHSAAEVLVVPELDGRVHLDVALRLLAERGVTSILVEAGGTLSAALIEAGLVDRVHAFVAPKIAGGAAARTPVEGQGCEEMAQALRLHDVHFEYLGDDVLITGYLPVGEGERDASLATFAQSTGAI